MMLYPDSRRNIIFSVWNDVLCTGLKGAGVKTTTLLDVHRAAPKFFTATAFPLTVTEGCQNCHRRLEYGQTAYRGWQNALIGMHYDAELAATMPAITKLYVRDHTDERAEGPSDLEWLGAELAAQRLDVRVGPVQDRRAGAAQRGDRQGEGRAPPHGRTRARRGRAGAAWWVR